MDTPVPPRRRGRPPGVPSRPRVKLSLRPGDWVEDALCNPMTADYFFSLTPSDRNTALQICEHCPVKDECGEWAIPREVQGIWGGLTEEERARRRRELRSIDPPANPPTVPSLPE